MTVPVGQQEPCLIYSACDFCTVAGDSTCRAAAASLASDFPTRNVTRRYGAKVEYRCGLGKEFQGASYGQTDATVTMECGWDGRWSPTSQLSQCTWVACIEPPIPENSTNLIRNYEGGSVVDFGAKVNCNQSIIY